MRECPLDNLNTGFLISPAGRRHVAGFRNFAYLLLLGNVLTEIKSSFLSDECDSLDSDILRSSPGRTSVFSKFRNLFCDAREWNGKVAESG